MIRRMIQSDSVHVASIHYEVLAGDFLPSLGRSFLRSLYECIFDLDKGFGFVSEEDQMVIGAIVAVEDMDHFYRDIFLKCFWTLTSKVIPPILKRPLLIKQLLETLLSSHTRNEGKDVKAELLFLGVFKPYQRRGIGRGLLEELNKEFSLRGIKRYVVRVYADNKGANNFYQKSGFKLQNSYTMYGRKWNLYHYHIDI
jgi:ribosomal protein S18 acetylase RimI-like enzyme